MGQIDLFQGHQVTLVPENAPSRLVPLGKYKGQPFEVLLQHPDYALWLMSSMYAKLQTSHPALLAFLVDRYGQPERTPAHNKLQNKFLDEAFCMRFALACSKTVRAVAAQLSEVKVNVEAVWRARVRELFSRQSWPSGMESREENERRWARGRSTANEALLFEGAHLDVYGAQGKSAKNATCPGASVSHLELEAQGADVRFLFSIGYSVSSRRHPSQREYQRPDELELAGLRERQLFRVEVKPVLGDDYPAVLRAMKAVGSTELLVGSYTGFGATWEEVVKVFYLSKITVVLLSEVEEIVIPDAFHSIPVTHLPTAVASAIVGEAFKESSETSHPKLPVPQTCGSLS